MIQVPSLNARKKKIMFDNAKRVFLVAEEGLASHGGEELFKRESVVDGPSVS